MTRVTGSMVACMGLCAFWMLACTGLGETDCSRDDDCGANESCVVGLCTPRVGGDGESSGGGEEGASGSGNSRADEGSGATEGTDDGGPGTMASGGESDVDGGDSGEGATSVGDGESSDGNTDGLAGSDGASGGSDVGAGSDSGGGSGEDGDGGESSDGDSDGTDEPVDPCGDEPTADVSCLIPVGAEGSGDTTICAAMRPFCGEDTIPAPGQAFAQCSEESVERSLAQLDEEVLAPLFLDERTCDGRDTNCDGRVDEQCCRVQGLVPEPIVMPSACVGAFGPDTGGQEPGEEEWTLVKRMLLDARSTGPEGDIVLTWLALVFPQGSPVGVLRVVRDRLDGRSGVVHEREVWDNGEDEDRFAHVVWSLTSEGGLLIGVTRQGELAAARVDAMATDVAPVRLDVEGFDELELETIVPFTQTGAEDRDRLFLALLVVVEGTVDDPIERRWELVEAELSDATVSIEGAFRLPLIFRDSEGVETVPLAAGDPTFPFSLWSDGDGVVHARWCWQDSNRETEEVTCVSVSDPLGEDDQGPREVEELGSLPGAVIWWRSPARGSRWITGFSELEQEDAPSSGGVFLLDTQAESFVLSTIRSMELADGWLPRVGFFELEGDLHFSSYYENDTGLQRLDIDGWHPGELLYAAYAAALVEPHRRVAGQWAAVSVVEGDETRWVIVEGLSGSEACAEPSAYALLPLTLDGQRLCLEGVEESD